MEVEDYVKIFKKAFELTYNEEASIAVMQECGKDSRTFMMKDKPEKFKAIIPSQPATEKQIMALKKHNLYREGMTKEQAQNVIKASIESSKPKEEEQVYY